MIIVTFPSGIRHACPMPALFEDFDDPHDIFP